MRDASNTSFLYWASHSLLGHVVLFQIAFSTPLLVTFLWMNYSDGALTLSWALYTVSVSVFAGVVGAIGFWYAISRPLIKKQKKDGAHESFN